MQKVKVKFLSVDVDTALNENGEVYNMLFVNFAKGQNPYRENEFISFKEKIFLSEKEKLDLNTIQTQDITNNIGDIMLCKDKNRYGEKKFLEIPFKCGYIKKISLEDDSYFMINSMYRADLVSAVTSENKK